MYDTMYDEARSPVSPRLLASSPAKFPARSLRTRKIGLGTRLQCLLVYQVLSSAVATSFQVALGFPLSNVSNISSLHRSTPSVNRNCWRVLFSSDDSTRKCNPNTCQLSTRPNLFRRRLTFSVILTWAIK